MTTLVLYLILDLLLFFLTVLRRLVVPLFDYARMALIADLEQGHYFK